jgi:multiple sugar transport system permease protein
MSLQIESSATIDGKKMNKLSYKTKKTIMPWLFVIPGIVFTIWLKYIPIFGAIYVSLFEYDIVNPPGKFVGLSNYVSLLKQEFFRQAWLNTLWFLILTILLTFFIPIIQAIFLSEIVRFRKLFSTLYLIPALVPLSINVILWKWIWNPDVGIANYITSMLGFGGQHAWLSDPTFTKFCIVFPGIIGGGINVLIYLAAVLGVPTDLYESAQIDGCSAWKKIFYITLPNIKFIITIQLLLTIIQTMQMLDAPFMYTSGGPSGASTSMGVYIYKAFNENLRYDHAATSGIMLLLVVMVMTIIQMKLDKQESE